MKAVQILLDERLLEALDADEEVQRDGRSAVLCRAAVDYRNRRRREAIADRYRHAYDLGTALDDELDGWPSEGTSSTR